MWERMVPDRRSEYMKMRDAARYAGVCVSTLRKWMRGGLRYARLPGGTVLVRASWVDEYLANFVCEGGGRDRIDEMIDEVMEGWDN